MFQLRKIYQIIISLLLLAAVAISGYFISGSDTANNQNNSNNSIAQTNLNAKDQTQQNQPAIPENKQENLINFTKEEIQKDNITSLVVHDASKIQNEIDANNNIAETKKIDDTDSVVLTFKSAQATEEFTQNTSNKNVEIEKEVPLELYASYNDTYYSKQRNLTQMSMAQGWAYYYTYNKTIAFIDTGIRGTHEDITGRVVAGYNVLTGASIGANTNSDDNGHGTAMASVASATANNGKGIVGVAYRTRMMPIKAFNSSGTGTSTNAATGIRWAASHGAKIINLSFGSGTYSKTLHDAIAYAKNNRGCLIVAAAGNNNSSVSYPAYDSLVLSVGSVNSNYNRSNFSNYGNTLDIAAPGEYIYAASASGNSSYTAVSGTSVAAAEVSGLAALSLGWHSGVSVNSNISYIKQSARKTSGMGGSSYTTYYGYGVVNYNYLQTKVGSFNYTYVTQNAFPNMRTSYNFRLTVKNSGGSRWRSDKVHLGTSHPDNRVPIFRREGSGASGWVSPNRIKMTTTTVAPGQNATFSFWMKSTGVSPGSYREYFTPVVDGITWMADRGIYWDIQVPHAYKYSYISQNANPSLNNGQAYKFTLRVRNTGTQTWSRSYVYLGTSHAQDRISSFLRKPTNPNTQDSGWVSGNRIKMKESRVAPGQTATFEFWMKVPWSMPHGTYQEYFQLVSKSGWMEDYGIYWNIRVK